MHASELTEHWRLRSDPDLHSADLESPRLETGHGLSLSLGLARSDLQVRLAIRPDPAAPGLAHSFAVQRDYQNRQTALARRLCQHEQWSLALTHCRVDSYRARCRYWASRLECGGEIEIGKRRKKGLRSRETNLTEGEREFWRDRYEEIQGTVASR